MLLNIYFKDNSKLASKAVSTEKSIGQSNQIEEKSIGQPSHLEEKG